MAGSTNRVEDVLRELLHQIAEATEITDINVDAGIALHKLDGVEDAVAP